MEALQVRQLQAGDLPATLKLSQGVGWSHRLDDWELHFQLGRGFTVRAADDSVVGTASWWAFGEKFGTIGLVIVDGNQQGKGIGRLLMDKIIADAGPRTLQLVATKAGQKLYRDCGFVECGGIEQRQALIETPPPLIIPADLTLRAVASGDRATIGALDLAACGVDRTALLDAVLAIGTGFIAERAGTAVGFALLRSSGRGTTIGPLIAADQAVAKALVARALNPSPGVVRIDIPAKAIEFKRWLDEIGLLCVDPVTLMVRGNAPARSDTVHQFGLVSQAFG